MTTPHETSHKHWGVSVDTSGDLIVRIETECLAGREISEADEDAIRTAAHHLLAFIGDPIPEAGNGDGWLPIETADKDADRLMLGIVRNDVLEEIHIGGYRYAINEDEVSCWWSDQCDDEITPTHWRPLSPPPSIRSSDTGRAE
jgi:hypothetical protein